MDVMDVVDVVEVEDAVLNSEALKVRRNVFNRGLWGL